MLVKFLSHLIYPLGFSLLLGFSGLLLLWLGWRRVAAGVLTFSLGWLLLWSLPPVADAVTRSLERQAEHLLVEALPEADVILVFGGVMRPALPGHPYPDLVAAADRVWHAARLYHAGKAPNVLLSGGRNDWQAGWPSQAQTMALFLSDLGVPEQAILLEERSRNTRENALFCLQTMQAEGLDNALLVTSALHMPRSLAAARAVGLDVIPVATDFLVINGSRNLLSWLPSASALQRSTLALHEWVGMVVYWWRGWLGGGAVNR